jgi:hypothetical protein
MYLSSARETQTADNVLLSRFVVTILGDIKVDFIIDIYDAITLCNGYNSVPLSSNRNCNSDMNCGKIVDICDPFYWQEIVGKRRRSNGTTQSVALFLTVGLRARAVICSLFSIGLGNLFQKRKRRLKWSICYCFGPHPVSPKWFASNIAS